MRKIYRMTVWAVVGLTTLVSCGEAKEKIEQVADWGATEYYNDFWWNHYTPTKMEQTLLLDFNDDAKSLFQGEVEFELASKNEHGEWVPARFMKLYKNGALCENNRLKFTVNDSEVVVGVEFLPETPEGSYSLMLTPVSLGGLDRIEQIELESGFIVQKTDIANPLAVKTMSLGTFLLIVLVAWIILSRLIFNPNVKFSKISFDYNNGSGEYMRRVGGCYKIICTNKRKKISIFHKIFVGGVYVEVNPFWEHEVTIMSGSRNRIRIVTRGEYGLPDDPVRREVFSIMDASGNKVNIETT